MTTKATDQYQGVDVLGDAVKITNTGDGLSKAVAVDPHPFVIGETVHVVIECKIAGVGFSAIKDVNGYLRTHVLKGGAATIVEEELVSELLQQQKARILEATGVKELDFDQDFSGDDESETSADAEVTPIDSKAKTTTRKRPSRAKS